MATHFSLHFLYCQQDTTHSTPLPCLYILKFLSLRINWRASVNLLIDQVSALVPTLFFVIVTLHLRGSLHPNPFQHNFGHLFLQLFKTFTSQVPSAGMPKHFCLHFLYYQQDTTHSTPLPCLYILKFLSLRINWRASVNLLIDQVSALVPTLFFVIVTLHLHGSLHPNPFQHNHGHRFLQPFKTFTSQVQSARIPKHFPTFSLLSAGHNTLDTSPMPIHPQVSVNQNQLESQCKSAHWSSLSSGANTFFRHCDTSLARKSAPPLFIIILGACFYSSSRHSQAKCQVQECLNIFVYIFSIISRIQHTRHLSHAYTSSSFCHSESIGEPV